MLTQVRKVVGYCPQFDALLEKLTVQETLYMYGRLRGVPESRLGRTVDDVTDKLLLKSYVNKLAGNLR